MAQARHRNSPPETIPPETDVPLLQGGPGDGETPPEPLSDGPEAPSTISPPGEPPAPPAGAPITIGGRQYTVEPELAQALSEQQQQFSQISREFGDLQSRYSRLESALTPRQAPTPEFDWETQLFEKPREAMMRLKQDIVHDLTSRYEGDQQQQRFWGSFFRTNPDLAEEDLIVRAVAQEMLPVWADEPLSRMDAFADELAKTTRSHILRLSRKGREADAPAAPRPTGRAVVEGASRGRTPTPPAEEGPSSLADLLRQRQAARRRAATRESAGG